jgi:esterase/lipase superfamily enzyme
MTDTATSVVAFDGVMENAYGSRLESPIAFNGSYDHVLNFEDIPRNEQLSEADILKVVNDARKANARQKAMQKALDDAGIVKPTLESSPELQLRNMVKSLVASGKYTEEQATTFAKAALA